MDTRRQFLKKAALFSGAAGITGFPIDSIRRALAIEPERGSTFWDAEHVVILMQENRSFDHAFGTLRGVRGFNDPRAITLPDGNPVWIQTDAAGESYVPFRFDIKDSNVTWMGSIPHSWTDQVDARNEGRYDGWLDAKRSGRKEYAHMPLTLGYYTRQDIPFYYELADAFTICDQHFCSSLTGTTPNRLHLWTGTIRAEQNAQSPANVLNSDTDYDTEVSWTTFPERLEDHGISWKIYQNELSVGVGFDDEEDAWLANYGDNPIEHFTQFHVRMSPAHRRYLESAAQTLPQEIAQLQREAETGELSSREATRLAQRIKKSTELLQQVEDERRKWNQQNFERLSPREKSLHEKAFCTNVDDPHYHELIEITYQDGDVERQVQVPKGDLLHQFRQDVLKGTLPMVSWIVAPERLSDHPSSAWYGAWYIAEIMDILTKNAAVWKKTIFILTYDENDGYFDHVPPFVAPHPRRPNTGLVSQGIDTSLEYVEREQELERKPADEARDSPIGLAYRVPMIIASPWSRGGFVCSQVFDHTSPLQFLEKFLTNKTGKEIREPNISQWRRTVCGNLTSAFRPHAGEAGEAIESLSFPERDAFIEEIHRAQFKAPPTGFTKLSRADIEQIRLAPSKSPLLPSQEPGVRPACAIPYELAVEGTLSDDRKQFRIRFEAGAELFRQQAAGAPFIVYAYHGIGDVRIRNYAVTPGDHLDDSWPLGDFADGHYHLAVYGPNGFYREFRGGTRDPRLDVQLRRARSRAADGSLGANVELRVINRDRRPHDLEVVDRSYSSGRHVLRVTPGENMTREVNTQQSHGWYDLHVCVVGNSLLKKAFAGHVETGKSSFSDPAMGG